MGSTRVQAWLVGVTVACCCAGLASGQRGSPHGGYYSRRVPSSGYSYNGRSVPSYDNSFRPLPNYRAPTHSGPGNSHGINGASSSYGAGLRNARFRFGEPIVAAASPNAAVVQAPPAQAVAGAPFVFTPVGGASTGKSAIADVITGSGPVADPALLIAQDTLSASSASDTTLTAGAATAGGGAVTGTAGVPVIATGPSRPPKVHTIHTHDAPQHIRIEEFRAPNQLIRVHEAPQAPPEVVHVRAPNGRPTVVRVISHSSGAAHVERVVHEARGVQVIDVQRPPPPPARIVQIVRGPPTPPRILFHQDPADTHAEIRVEVPSLPVVAAPAVVQRQVGVAPAFVQRTQPAAASAIVHHVRASAPQPTVVQAVGASTVTPVVAHGIAARLPSNSHQLAVPGVQLPPSVGLASSPSAYRSYQSQIVAPAATTTSVLQSPLLFQQHHEFQHLQQPQQQLVHHQQQRHLPLQQAATASTTARHQDGSAVQQTDAVPVGVGYTMYGAGYGRVYSAYFRLGQAHTQSS